MKTYLEDLNKTEDNQVLAWLMPIILGSLLALVILMFISNSMMITNTKMIESSEIAENPTAMLKNNKQYNPSCSFGKTLNQCFTARQKICEADLEISVSSDYSSRRFWFN